MPPPPASPQPIDPAAAASQMEGVVEVGGSSSIAPASLTRGQLGYRIEIGDPKKRAWMDRKNAASRAKRKKLAKKKV